ncbi:MAG: methyltransferase, partial [Oscillospiraceae bacterium]|nr:methyltransferase [Oscillospiraceae bacterium]
MTERISQFLNQDIAYIVISGVRKGAESEYSKVTVKPFESKDGVKYQLEYTKGKQVVHQNIEKSALAESIAVLFETFTQCVIYGAENDFHLNCFNGKIKAKTMSPSKKVKVAAHNKQKEYVFNEGDDIDFLIYLGVMTKDKKVVKAKYNKFRQINKYLELLKSSIDTLPEDRPLKIVDFGCGKAYLTFALYYYVVKILGREAYITGLDLKEDVIDY